MIKKIDNKGYTIIEIIVVIALLIVIAGIFSVNIILNLNKQRNEENNITISEIISAANTYVSINPEKIEALYTGSGYVDIPVGDLRDAGLINEDLKNAETGERIPDDEIIRIKLDEGDSLEIIYPAEGSLDTWEFVLEDLYIDFDESSSSAWCNIDSENILKSNVYTGLVTNLTDYASIPSKLYLMNTKNNANLFAGNYFDPNGVNLHVESCDVDPSKTGTYTITYKYFDEDLETEKTGKRTVHVASFSEDVISFTGVINPNEKGISTPIIRGTDPNIIPIKIVETHRNGKKIINTTIGELGKNDIYYTLDKFKTDEVISNTSAILTRTKKNSDGSLAEAQKLPYTIIPDVYQLNYDVNKGNPLSPNNKQVKYNVKYGEFDNKIVNPTRRGYTFNYWFTPAQKCRRATNTITYELTLPNDHITNDNLMINLCDHTIQAHWTPNKYTIYFNGNASDASVGQPSKVVTYDDTYGTLPTPSKTGYTFLGWYTSPNGGTQITSNTIVNIIENTTYYAHWKANQYTVTFSGSGSKTVTYDSPYGVLPSRSGYSDSYSSQVSERCTRSTHCYYSFTGWGVYSSTIVKTPYNHTLYPNYSSSCSSSTYCKPEPKPEPTPAPTTPSKDPTPTKPEPSVKEEETCVPKCEATGCGTAEQRSQICTNEVEAIFNEKGHWPGKDCVNWGGPNSPECKIYEHNHAAQGPLTSEIAQNRGDDVTPVFDGASWVDPDNPEKHYNLPATNKKK